ncbi:polyphosphate polymerase domain-containing protein [Paenibacillus sp. J5C_2022]|uniref:polyphosphate polymerase domain-containing protein n=1 Tax=Paenibacillus sp. J5C2022 TaxID=2977129 RepID=UPI0021D3597A|nr:polyphosphate polymerase domain-containing protein [Paenibacillus sp. J5C2022]MCU6710801.1 polyphosphate polymerase domain-containing protein [Paenibacillus sp. J5C2022]
MLYRGRKLRTEHKYYLHIHDYATVSHRVSSLLRMDPHSISEEGYNIRSLYFDGPHAHSLHDKNNGIFKRDKYRIRIYNGSDAVISVERKSKFGEYVCKESARISLAEYEDILAGEYDCLADKETMLLREFHAALAYRAFRPVVIVDYWREAYIYEHGNVRITFDKKLSAGVNTIDLFDPNLVLEEVIPVPQTIMEVKFDAYFPDHVRKLVNPTSHIRSSISKYVLCREVGIKHFKE